MAELDKALVPVEVELPQWMWAAVEEKGIDLSALLEKAVRDLLSSHKEEETL